MKIPLVDLKSQYNAVRDEIDQAIHDVINDTAFIGGKYSKIFEDDFAQYCRVKFCVGVGNGTDALYIALRSLGVGPGDEVITAANTFIATSESITMTGARPVFVDCNPETYNIDPSLIPAFITPQTKAIVPVHLYGQPARMKEIIRIAHEHGIFVVEDAAQAHGAEIDGQRVGTFGDLACFSFYPGKNLGAYGDAGAIVTNDEKSAIKCRMIANHGRVQKYDHDFEGINSRLDGLQGAILSVKLKYLEDWTSKRRDVAFRYDEELANFRGVICPVVDSGNRHVYHLYVIRVKNRKIVQKYLKEQDIDTGIHYPIALPNLQAYRYLGHKPEDFPVASAYSNEILSLPIYPELTEEQVSYIFHHLKYAIKE
jgi:dTDP-4-amino-4,6-dideoxygalactose transaminase